MPLGHAPTTIKDAKKILGRYRSKPPETSVSWSRRAIESLCFMTCKVLYALKGSMIEKGPQSDAVSHEARVPIPFFAHQRSEQHMPVCLFPLST